MKGEFESDSVSINSCSDDLSSENNDWKSACVKKNDIDIDSVIGDDELRDEFPYKISEKLSHAQVDSYYKPIKSLSKSTNILLTKSKIQFDNLNHSGSKMNEELKLELSDKSQFILDESKKFYRKKEESEITSIQEDLNIQMKPLRFNTCNVINSSMDRLNKKEENEQLKRIKISCQKIIFEYENSDSEDIDGSSTSLPSNEAYKNSQK